MQSMGWKISHVIMATGSLLTASGQAIETPIRQFVTDSRAVGEGDVFVALQGEHFDAHDFVTGVFAQGAAAAVVNRAWHQQQKALPADQLFLVTDDTLLALQHIARAWRRQLNPKVFALTGTNGKTTTKEMLANVLSPAHRTQGNFNNHIGVPLTLLAMRHPIEQAVIEMGMNHAGEIAALCEIAEPDAGLITNIGRGHTEHLGGLDGVRRAKQELFDYLAEKRKPACVNSDDVEVVRAARDAGLQELTTFGFNNAATVQGEDLKLSPEGEPVFTWQGHTIQVPVAGLHNGSNALAAIAGGLLFACSAEQILAGIHQPLDVTGRMRRYALQDITIIDDTYNANPESMLAALKTLKAMPGSGRHVAALGDMLELGDIAAEAHEAVLQHALDLGVDEILVFGPEMHAASERLANKRIMSFAEHDHIAAKLADRLSGGDMLLAKGSRGMKMEHVLSELNDILQRSTS